MNVIEDCYSAIQRYKLRVKCKNCLSTLEVFYSDISPWKLYSWFGSTYYIFTFKCLACGKDNKLEGSLLPDYVVKNLKRHAQGRVWTLSQGYNF